MSARRAVEQQLAGQGPVNIAGTVTSHFTLIHNRAYLLPSYSTLTLAPVPAFHYHNNRVIVAHFEIVTHIE